MSFKILTTGLLDEVLERNKLIERLADVVGVEEIIFDRIAKEGLINDDYSKTIIVVSFPVGISSEDLEVLVTKVNERYQNLQDRMR